MKQLIFFAILFFLFGSCNIDLQETVEKRNEQDSTKIENDNIPSTVKYTINNKVVTKEAYTELLNKLTPIEGTDHCKKFAGGGRSSHEANDAEGITWICEGEVTINVNESRIYIK